ncbi:hypothetical protein HRM2_30190 [Desulforapulum autotrophicum HRM2]|uniref:Uncharacterized protein n=1 Tax=Desulforapulum autotrophicum (strain ATCC 43914 / DSM 3382 / VKM B-1955 / HRM2) TaxID=177437 RepID=C0QK76_DESAH|nr:hypothetical protein [Desulforapulum autotrophicum]ACN16102.1 hypothetical protein HRM2_30190 [Desulforapulum autotrophicum HRM2]
MKNTGGKELLYLFTIILVVGGIATGVSFGGRYTNIYLTVLSLSGLCNLLYIKWLAFGLSTKWRRVALAVTGIYGSGTTWRNLRHG